MVGLSIPAGGLRHITGCGLKLILAVSIVTFASSRTNILQGIVHLILFASYVQLLIEG
jgi:Ca2+:H+ antiporter